MNLDKKFAIFLEIAGALNKHGITPTLYGSLGLYRLIGQLDEIDDIDIVVPEIYAKEKLQELIKIMQDIGYKQGKTFPHEFFKDKEQIGFELEEELKEFAGVDLSEYTTTNVNNAEFKELRLEDYLKFYRKALKEREDKVRKIKPKINALEKLLESKKNNNFAFIDGANLHNAVKELGWPFDYKRFRVWLSDKYDVDKAFIFIGLIPKYKDLYTYLQNVGFTLVFKEVVYDGSGKPKGNCDADLVLQAVKGSYEHNFNSAVIVTSDGDYASLVKFLQEKKKLKIIISPSVEKKCSILLKRTNVPIAYINDQRSILETQK
ncbi:MAG: nucleotidyltransferase [bacterium]|nr:nucleotidyltransferase [bacterium]